MHDLIFVLMLSLWGVGLGAWLMRRLGWGNVTGLDAMGVALPLGFGILALATLGLGESGWLNGRGLAGVLVVGAVPAVRAWLAWGNRRSDRAAEAVEAGRRTVLDWLFDFTIGLAITGTFVCAMVPVTDGDALCYHLQVPKVFLASGAVGFDPDLHETVYPLVVECLYAVGLHFASPVSCRLIQWVLGLSLGASATMLARPWLGSRARWAGTITVLVPAISNGMSAPLNDVALAAYGTAALAAWMRAMDRPARGLTVLAGLLAGLAIGVKYPAIVWVGLLGLVWMGASVMTMWKGRNEGGIGFSRIRQVLLYGIVVVVIGGPWYLRSAIHTGNPVYPFFRHTFGGSGLDEVLDPVKRPMEPTVLNLLTAIGPMTLEPDRFDSFSHQFGPVFLLFLPAILLKRPPARLAILLGLGYVFLTLCLTQRQSMRFLLVAIPPMAVGVAWVVHRWSARANWPAKLLCAGLAGVLVFEAGLAASRVRHGLPVAVGLESRDAYLTRTEPTYRVGRWVEANLSREARIVGQDHRGFYIPRPYTMELAHRRRTGLGRQGESPEALISTLRARGFTHLLMCPPIPEDAVEFDPTLGRRLSTWLDSHAPIYRELIADADGVQRAYALYALKPETRGLAMSGREAVR